MKCATCRHYRPRHAGTQATGDDMTDQGRAMNRSEAINNAIRYVERARQAEPMDVLGLAALAQAWAAIAALLPETESAP